LGRAFYYSLCHRNGAASGVFLKQKEAEKGKQKQEYIKQPIPQKRDRFFCSLTTT